MVYNWLKFLHILSATLLLTSMAYCYQLWKRFPTPRGAAIVFRQIQLQTVLFVVPFSLIQLITGFSMISINKENLAQTWIGGSFIGFLTLISSWFGFIYFLLLSQQVTTQQVSQNEMFFHYRRIQSFMLKLCAVAVGAMIFFMANKVA